MATPDFSKIWASASPLPAFTFTDAEYTEGWDFVGSAPPTKNQFDAWFRYVDERLKWLFDQMEATASKLYPVGSVYISFNSTDPSTLFGGTWVRLKDRFLLASGDTYAANTTGGNATKTIGVNNIPAHNHTVNASGNHNHTATTSTAGNHSHTRGSMNITGDFSGVGQKYGGTTPTVNGAFSVKNTANQPQQGVEVSNSGERDDWFGFDASKSWTGSTSTAGNHTHTLTTNTTGSHTHTTNNTGGGLPLNIMPPYQTVYMWRRTA